MSRSEGAIALRRIGKTHEELARILGVSRVAVGNWAGGVRKPMPEHRQRIFERLGIPIEAWDRPAKIGGSPIDRALAAARHAKETEGVTSPVTSVTSPVTSVTSVTSRIPDGAIPKAVELERMAHGLMSKLLEDQLATPMEQAKVMASVASTLCSRGSSHWRLVRLAEVTKEPREALGVLHERDELHPSVAL